jgi:competence protein ComFC
MFAFIADALFPRYCAVCEMEGDVLCRACKARWRPAPPIMDGERFAFFSYADPVARKLLQAWKYGYDERAWHVLRVEMMERMPQFQIWLAFRDAEVFVPVPLFYVKRNERGFDQAIEVASACSAMTDIPVERLVLRAASVKPQAQKTKEERLQSYIQNPFVVAAGRAARVQSRVLLVDDVYTTGATMRAAAHALTSAGHESVGYVSVLLGGSD